MRLAWLMSAMWSEKNRRLAALVVWRQQAAFHCGDDVQVSASRSSSMGGMGRAGWLDPCSGQLSPLSLAVDKGRLFPITKGLRW
jgi:hypothetical protein